MEISPVTGSTAIHVKNCDFPLPTSSSFTRVGGDHVSPRSVDFMINTSGSPLRESTQLTYTLPRYADSEISATVTGMPFALSIPETVISHPPGVTVITASLPQFLPPSRDLS